MRISVILRDTAGSKSSCSNLFAYAISQIIKVSNLIEIAIKCIIGG